MAATYGAVLPEIPYLASLVGIGSAPELASVGVQMSAVAGQNLLRSDATLGAIAAEGGGAMTTLYRGVMPAELESIEQTGQFLNLGSAEGKYFSMTAEGVSSYAKQAVMSFGDAPYTMVQTLIPTNLLSPQMMVTVDRGIQAVVVPDFLLPNMTPNIMPYMVVPH